MKDNEIDLSYHTMRELFKPKIISYLQIAEDISFSKAEEIWEKAFIFDEKVYEIMEMIIKNENITIIINRNPTLDIEYHNLGSLNLSNSGELLEWLPDARKCA